MYIILPPELLKNVATFIEHETRTRKLIGDQKFPVELLNGVLMLLRGDRGNVSFIKQTHVLSTQQVCKWTSNIKSGQLPAQGRHWVAMPFMRNHLISAVMFPIRLTSYTLQSSVCNKQST